MRKLPFAKPTRRKRAKQKAQLLQKTRIKRRKRSKSEFERIYGGDERRKFVQSLPCIVQNSWHGGLIEVAHIKNGGTGRKADARFTVPACSRHHECFHQWGRETFEQEFGIDLEQEAAKCEAAWQAYNQPKGAESC